MRTAFAALFLTAASLVGAAAPPTPWFPAPRSTPDPADTLPKPPPNAPVLTADLRYVFDMPGDCVVRAYPPGLVSFEKKKGPRDVTARFYGGPGTEEDRAFAGPFVWIGKATGTGDVTVVVTPLGLKDEKEILTDSFRVDSGKVVPPVVPVVPVTDPLLGPVQVAYDADASPTKAADRVSMAAVFRALADATQSPTVKTAGDLYSLNSLSMKSRIDGRLGGVGKVLATDFGTIFPVGTKESYVLTPADRDAAKTRLLRYASILDGVK